MLDSPGRIHWRGSSTPRRTRFERAPSTCGVGRRTLHRLRGGLAARQPDRTVTADARAWLAERGYDPVYGARPLQRVLRQELENRLARALIDGTVDDGDEVVVEVGEAGLVLTPA